MNKYELMYILDPGVDGEERKELIDRFTKLLTDNGALIDKVDEWGKRRLAYPINFKNEGYYVLVTFQSGPAVPKEIERNLRISDMVMRAMTVKIEQKRTSVKPRQGGFRQSAMTFDAQASRDRDERPDTVPQPTPVSTVAEAAEPVKTAEAADTAQAPDAPTATEVGPDDE